MQKFLLVSLLLVALSSCSLPWAKKDESFLGLYKANVHASLGSLEELGTLLGINRHESFEGNIESGVNVPGIFSGSLHSDYSGLIDGRNSQSLFKNVSILFTSLLSSGSVSADEIGLLSHNADSYISYKNLSSLGVIPDAVSAVIKKYENTWLNVTEQSQADMSDEELVGYNIGKNIFTKSLSDIEKYATDYAIWKDTADLGMSGSLHVWSVELNRANILELTKRLSLDLAGTGMTQENAQMIQKNLETLSFSGKIGFDPEDPTISLLDGTVSLSGATLAQITVIRNHDNGTIHIINPEQKVTIQCNYGKKDGKYSFDGNITREGIEMGKISGYIDRIGNKFHELSIEASAQGMTVSLKHTQEGDKFSGKLSAVVATLEWSGTITDERLSGLKMNGVAPFGSFTADLTSTGANMVQGPVIVKSGQDVIASANVGLEVAREKFGLLIDILSQEFPAHFDFLIRAKSNPSVTPVVIPTNVKSFQEFIKEIDALTPHESETLPLESESGNTSLMDTTHSSMDTTGDTPAPSVSLPQ